MSTNILIINMNYLGDALMTTPAIRAIKTNFRDSRIDVIAGSTNKYGALEILSLDPDIDRLIPRINGGSFKRGWQLFNVIRAGMYDLVVVLPSLPFYVAIAKLAAGSGVIAVPKAREDCHMAEHMLKTISAAFPSVPVQSQMVMQVPRAASHFAAQVTANLDCSRPLVALNVGSSRPQKRWPPVNFASAILECLQSGRNVVLLGSADREDRLTVETLLALLEGKVDLGEGRFLNLVGKTSLDELSGIIEVCNAIVTGDTGAMHIAAALNVPIVALFGSTKSDFTGPYGGAENVVINLKLPCSPCGTHPTCGGKFQCMSGITADLVLNALDTILKREKVLHAS